MDKPNKEKFRQILDQPVLSCTEDEIRFAFNIMGFDLKEFFMNNERVMFEIHYRRHYIIKVELFQGIVLFSNPWVYFNGDKNTHHVNFQFTGHLIDLLAMYLDLFGPIFLKPLDYKPEHVPGWSACGSASESKEYWSIIQEVAEHIMKKEATLS